MIKESIALLGRKAKDKVTGCEGIISSVGFDLYGCVQAVLTPGLDKDGKVKDQHWFDVQRLEVDLKTPPAMPLPDFDAKGQPKTYDSGPAPKPTTRQPRRV